MKTYRFTCMRGYEITNDYGYRTLKAAKRAVKEWQSYGWHIDYIDDSDGRIAAVIDHDAMAKASKGFNR